MSPGESGASIDELLDRAVRAINEGEIYRFFIKPFNATDLNAAVSLAKGCPILEVGGSVEVRLIQRM